MKNLKSTLNNDFKELIIKLRDKEASSHTLFFRQHRVREKVPDRPCDRTVFVSGIPGFLNEVTLREVFGAFGQISAVFLRSSFSSQLPGSITSSTFKSEQKPACFMVAHIVFEESSSLKKVLSNQLPILIPKKELHCGFTKWAQDFNNQLVDVSTMKKEIADFMTAYDKDTAQKDEEEKRANQEDSEGWITVSKKSRNPGFARKESVLKKVSKKGEERRKKKELTNFYRFQIKESKMKNLMALRQKFEEDKKKVAALKATRRFKPF